MLYWIEAEGMGHYFFYAYFVCILILFIIFKGRRVRFLVPSLIITLILVNPLFYKYWDRIGLYAYWRILWIVPVVPIVATVVPAFTERYSEVAALKNPWKNAGKLLLTLLGVVAVIFGGTFIYETNRGQFYKAENKSKLPDYVVQIADRLLELEDHPKIIAQDPIGVYIRQYTGKIDTLYGRDITANYIGFPSDDAITAHSILSNPESDPSKLNTMMLNNGYNYLVMTERNAEGFELIDTIGGYGIYRATGKPSVIKERNELGQVISIITIDEQLRPVDNDNGYAITQFSYDYNGFVCNEYRTTVDGKGRGGALWTKDAKGKVLTEYKLDEQGQKYQHGGYYGWTQLYDAEEVSSRTYVDADGTPVQRNDGYTRIEWKEIDGVKIVQFYDLAGTELDPDGINLMSELPGEHTDWMKPQPDKENVCFTLDTINLPKRKVGDIFTCQLEIEFKDVSCTEGRVFGFWTQGSVDKTWSIWNVWNPSLVKLTDPPKNGIYSFTSLFQIDEKTANASEFDIGFRCDNWKTGEFRIRKIKIEKGELSEWTPGF